MAKILAKSSPLDPKTSVSEVHPGCGSLNWSTLRRSHDLNKMAGWHRKNQENMDLSGT